MPCETIDLTEKDLKALFEMSVKVIDEKFGNEYALRNPSLLSTVVQAATEVYLVNNAN